MQRRALKPRRTPAAGASPSDRSVVIATERDGDHVDLLVRDSGPGIPSGVQPHLFESFFSTKTEGLGLGLVIVRSIVERHNGRVLVENAPTGGAVFRVRFPAAAGTPALPDRHATNEKQRR